MQPVPDEEVDARLERRRAAAVELAAAVRELTRAVVDTEVDADVLGRATALARDASQLLAAAVRPPNRPATIEGAQPVVARILSPVRGDANPVSPPLQVVRADPAGGETEFSCTLHRVHEGPPTFAHGGMSAMLLDQVLGETVALAGRTGLTVSLEVRYRRPVPLGRPLRLVGRVVRRVDSQVDGRVDGAGAAGGRVRAEGEITTAADPDTVLVSAEATFAVLRRDQARRIFSHVERD